MFSSLPVCNIAEHFQNSYTMKHSNTEKALTAFNSRDYKTASYIWNTGFCFPDDEATLRHIYNKAQEEIKNNKADVHLYAIAGFLFLDYSDFFTDNREEALLQVVSWSKAGLDLDKKDAYCARHAGSALYWLEDYEAAETYYQQAIAADPSATLMVRLFKLKYRNQAMPDYNQLQLSFEGTSAMDYYNAGVEINQVTRNFDDAQHPHYKHLTQLKRKAYQRAYQLYADTLVNGTGLDTNYDPHTFAMCCNNLASEAIGSGDYQQAIDYVNTGMKFSQFQYLLENRFYAYELSKQYEKAGADALQMFEEYETGIGDVLYFRLAQAICSYYRVTNDSEEEINWAEAAMQSYLELDAEMQMHPELLKYYSNIMMAKANAELKLGKYEANDYAQTQDTLLMENPTDPTLIINRAMLFVNEGENEKALDCYDQAIHYAVEQERNHSLKVAFYNKGHLLITVFNDSHQALQNFAQIEPLGLADFWSHYWCAFCCYNLEQDEECYNYAEKALTLLSQTENVHADIIAQLHEYKGTALFGFERYSEALASYRKSLEYADTPTARENIQKLESMGAGKSSNDKGIKGLFGKFFK